MSAGPTVWPTVLVPGRARKLIRDSELDYVVVGAAGWIGRATLDVLWTALGSSAFEKRVVVLGSQTRAVELRPGVTVLCRALPEWRNVLPRGSCIVIHNAFLTRDRVAGMPLDAYVRQNRALSAEVLELARLADLRGVVLPSSGAVYGRDGALETDLAANPYGALKAEDERAFTDLARARGAALAIPRIFGLSGEYINKLDTYALASVIEALRQGEPVRLKARHPVLRSYVYVGDLLGLALSIVLAREPSIELFDTAGEMPVEIGELARLAATTLGRSDPAILRDFDPTLSADRYVGNPDRIRALFRAHGIAPLSLSDQVARTAAYLYAAVGR